jgi:leucyl aminopeptidase (aminopeptidase T)
MTGDAVTVSKESIARVADIAVATCAAVQPGERLLVLTDTGGDPDLADAIADAGRQAGAEVILLRFEQVDTITKIPERVATAMAGSDVVIPVCKSRILYSDAVRTVKVNGRMLYMADVPTEFFLRPVVLDADYEALGRLAAAFKTILGGDHELHVSSARGTEATMTMVASRNLALSICRASQRGDHDYLPGGAWFGCPLERSVNGTFVIDCSIEPGVSGGVLNEPIVLTYRDGWLVSIDGGPEAQEFQAWLDSRDDQIRGFSHNGAGFNRAASRIGNLMEDERIMGAFNIAGGNNTLGWPGTNQSKFHFDGMILRASYSVDGVPLCEEGRFVHPALVAAIDGASTSA